MFRCPLYWLQSLWRCNWHIVGFSNWINSTLCVWGGEKPHTICEIRIFQGEWWRYPIEKEASSIRIFQGEWWRYPIEIEASSIRIFQGEWWRYPIEIEASSIRIFQGEWWRYPIEIEASSIRIKSFTGERRPNGIEHYNSQYKKWEPRSWDLMNIMEVAHSNVPNAFTLIGTSEINL